MVYSSIYISGNLISQELIAKLDDEGAIGQRPADFGLESGARVRQEIANAWTDANDYWKIYKRKLDALKESERGTTETRNQWMIPLLGILGYDVTYVSQAESINDKSYDISHRANNRDGFPIMIVSAKDQLDKKPEGNSRYRMSPHALLQEYLNVTEHTYGLVSNGKLLRLLRDNGRITRLTYLEFNLEKIFEEDLYADFALIYRLLHASRMPVRQTDTAESIVEKYYQDAIDAGTRIRGSLSKAVEKSIRIFANGLLQHPDNTLLRESLDNGSLNGLRFYQDQLRLVYRLLFIMTIEERGLVYPEQLTADEQRLSEIYNQFYSVQHIRNLSSKQHLVKGSHHQLYVRLWQNFFLYERQNYAAKLGLQALGSGIFEPGTMDLYAQCKMNNDRLLEAMYHLSYFTDQVSGQLIRVNYGALNVEEFGSVYEGLLDYQANVSEVNGIWQFDFVESNERSKSGSHYTPEELVQPLIKHSLEYLIQDRLKEKDPVEALLNLKVCDVACGSGHILLSAARRIALELARVKYKEEQPSPANMRWATREVINRCIYGVDKNPLAVDLCKVAMWLEAHNPGEPLNFLDHHIKCGDAIVGLAHRSELDNGIADEAFKALPGDEKDIASSYLKRNKAERKRGAQIGSAQQLTTEQQLVNTVEETIATYKTFSQLPETTPEEIERKSNAYKRFIGGKGFTFLKAMADTQVAQFFIPKTTANKELLMTDGDYRLILSGYKGWQDRKVAKATAVAHEQRIFHWFIEFPEVFNEGGFDCILGNPPFRGGLFITTDNGSAYTCFIKYNTSNAGSTTDLVSYFFRRDFELVSNKGFVSLIGTNSISEGDTRDTSLGVILERAGRIVFANKSVKWPGEATLHVSLISVTKSSAKFPIVLNNKLVENINSWLSSTENNFKPFNIFQIEKAYLGTTVYGKGFFLTEYEKEELLNENANNSLFIKPFLNGDDVLNHPQSKFSRYVLYFQGQSKEILESKYPLIYEFAYSRIFQERQKSSSKGRREKWWLYTSPADDIYVSIKDLNFVIVTCFTSKYPTFTILEKNQIFSNAVVVVCSDSFSRFGILQSNLHAFWIQEYGSTLETRQRYAVSDCYNTFPFPKFNSKVQSISEKYFKYRQDIQNNFQIGLTDLYNRFHNPEENVEVLHLRKLQIDLDCSVLDAYGWNDIQMLHDFYEVDYLPENDRIRYTIHPDARKEVLKRLLELNHQIHAEEVEEGLFDKKPTAKSKKKKGTNSDQNQLF